MFLFGLAAIGLTALPGSALSQWPMRGTPERAAFEEAFYGTPHYLSVRMAYRHGNQDQILESVVECRGVRQTPAIGSLQRSYSDKIPLRNFISRRLSDGSAMFLHLPPGICTLWPEKWMPAKFAKSLQPDTRFPPEFYPLVYWADRPTDPNLVEMYASRTGLNSPTSEVSFRTFAIAVADRSDDDKSRQAAARERAEAIPHVLDRYNQLSERQFWRTWSTALRGIPESLWGQYARLSSLISKYEKRNDVVAFSADELAEVTEDLADIDVVISRVGGLGFESGLAGVDGKAGVLFCHGHKIKSRSSFLRERCVFPGDWDVPVVCEALSGCVARTDKVGTRLYLRNDDTRPPAFPIIKFDGRAVTRSVSGSQMLVYLPMRRLLIRL